MGKDKDLKEAQKMLDAKLESVKELAKEVPYHAVELRLVDEEGNVKIKGAIKVADMMAVEAMNKMSKQEVIGMFFTAIEDDLETKLKERNED